MYLYRVDADLSDEFFEKLHISKFIIVKETPKGYWALVYAKRKFILKGSNGKRFAYISEDDALKGYIKRKERQICINKAQIARAKKGIELAKKILC
jgi:hypothetical protein